jgi:hypothetical protein
VRGVLKVRRYVRRDLPQARASLAGTQPASRNVMGTFLLVTVAIVGLAQGLVSWGATFSAPRLRL